MSDRGDQTEITLVFPLSVQSDLMESAIKKSKKDTRRRGIRRRESRPDTSVGVVADENQKKMNKKRLNAAVEIGKPPPISWKMIKKIDSSWLEKKRHTPPRNSAP